MKKMKALIKGLFFQHFDNLLVMPYTNSKLIFRQQPILFKSFSVQALSNFTDIQSKKHLFNIFCRKVATHVISEENILLQVLLF